MIFYIVRYGQYRDKIHFVTFGSDKDNNKVSSRAAVEYVINIDKLTERDMKDGFDVFVCNELHQFAIRQKGYEIYEIPPNKP